MRGRTHVFWTAFPAISSHVVVFSPLFTTRHFTVLSLSCKHWHRLFTGSGRGALMDLVGPYAAWVDFVLKPEAGEKCIFKNTHRCVKPPHKGGLRSLKLALVLTYCICQKHSVVRCIEQQKGLETETNHQLWILKCPFQHFITGLVLIRAVNGQEPARHFSLTRQLLRLKKFTRPKCVEWAF